MRKHFISVRGVFIRFCENHKDINRWISAWLHIMEYHKNRYLGLIIWRSKVQALAGLHWKSSTYKDFVGAFSFVGDLQVTFLRQKWPRVTLWNIERFFASSRNVFAKITAKTRSIISKLQAGEANQIPDLGMWFGVSQLIIKKTYLVDIWTAKHIKMGM